MPADQRGRLRPLTREYRRWQRTRALLVKQCARWLAFIDQLADHRLRRWPPPKPDDGPGELAPAARERALRQVRRLEQSFLSLVKNLRPHSRSP